MKLRISHIKSTYNRAIIIGALASVRSWHKEAFLDGSARLTKTAAFHS
jgi:hypothetical protein